MWQMLKLHYSSSKLYPEENAPTCQHQNAINSEKYREALKAH